MRRRYLGRGVLIVTALAGVGLAGCNGKPTADTETQAVATADIIGPVPQCAAGSAHPNVCCRDGTCVTSTAAPFQACPTGDLLFPDRRRCCPLAGGDCVDAAVGGAAGVTGSSSGCSLPCGPEGHAPPTANCGIAPGPNPTVSCDYCCSGLGCYNNVCPCPMSVSPCNCGITCAACPSGWSTPAAQVDLCCESPTRCFSQSAQVQAPEGSGTISGPDGCEAASSAGGQLYDVKCDAKTSSCTCALDGTMTKQYAFANGAGCSLQMCGFPH